MNISDQIKSAIRDSGQSLSEIARGAGIAQPGLSRFMNSDPAVHRDIRLEATADKLAKYFGLTLKPEDEKKPVASTRKSTKRKK